MNLLSVKNLVKHGREAPLFTDVTFGLEEGEKAALIGRNGTGKSTLLNCIAGVLVSDDGTVVFNKEAGVSYLPQNPVFNPENTIREHIFCANEQVKGSKLDIIQEYEELCTKIADNSNISTALQQNFDRVSALMSEKNLWTYESEIKSILTMLNIGSALDRKMGELSGGMIKKVALAQTLVEDTKLILLDEPTNHLDITTIAWLEDYLRDTNRSVLMVTHDRYFLDSVCDNIYELENGHFNRYKGNFSTYLEKKATEMEIAQNTERRIESVLRTERDWLMRGPCARGTKARARVDNINRLINREKLKSDEGFTFEVAGRRMGGKILELHNISKAYSKSANSAVHVLDDFSYNFKKGERIGIFGDNGSGKSTLLNIITGSIQPDNGSVIKGLNTVFGYYQQNPYFAQTNLTVLEYIKEAAEYIETNDGKTLSASQMLEQFGFEGKIQYSPVSSLSGGERKRLFLIRLLMTNPNFLILDEPTNDFDIFTMSILESFLSGFAGCILVVSHDRYFMDKIADTLLILEEDGSVSGYVGKCSEYIDYKKECQKQKQLETKKEQEHVIEKQKHTSVHTSVETKQRRTFKEQKEFNALEERIFEEEARKEELEQFLSSGESDHVKLESISKEYAALLPKLEADYKRWEELADLGEY